MIVVSATSTLVDVAMTVTINPNKCKEYQSRVKDIHREGNSIARKLFTIIDETFVTPLDREDISRLSTFIEKILNNTHKVANRFILFNIGKPSSDMLKMIIILIDMSMHVSTPISQLRNLKGPYKIIEESNTISKYEEQADVVYEKAISALFEANDAIEILRSKEIFDFLQRAISRCVDLNELLEDLVLKYA